MEIFDILQQATPIESFLLGCALVYLLGKGILKLPFIKLRFKADNRTTHEGCALHSDLQRIVADQIRIFRIKTTEILYEQMSNLEVIHDDITLKMRSIYNDIAKNDTDIERYNILVSHMEHDVKGITRKWFKENHFTSRTDQEFSTYVDEKVNHLISRVVYHLDTRYKGYDISRDKLKKINEKELVPYAQMKFRKCFYDARAISASWERKIKEIEGK